MRITQAYGRGAILGGSLREASHDRVRYMDFCKAIGENHLLLRKMVGCPAWATKHRSVLDAAFLKRLRLHSV